MKHFHLTFPIIFFLFLPSLQAQEFGENVRLSGNQERNTYAAGGLVSSSARINGDLIVSGGQINIGGEVLSDLITIGGNTTISAKIGDDARIAGGQIQILSPIGGDLMAAGGQINVSPDVSIGGRLFAAGGMIDLSGNVEDDVFIAAGTVLLSGHIKGNVNIECDRLVLLESAVVDGQLTYSSPNELEQKPGAKVAGGITYNKTERESYHEAGILGIVLMFTTSVVFFFLFPGFSGTSSQSLRSNFLPSLGLGVLLFLCLPVIALFSMAVVAGLWIGLALIAIYLLLLLTGLLLGILCISDWSASLVKVDLQNKSWRILSIFITSFALGIIQLVPFVGAILSLLIMLTGTGTAGMEIYRKYRAG